MHGGGPKVVPGKPLPDEYLEQRLDLLEVGVHNLQRNIEIARLFVVSEVVAINRFPADTDEEVAMAVKAAESAGAGAAVMSDHWARGGAGAVELAEAVVAACETPSECRLLYDDDLPLKQKIETIAKKVYHAGDVAYEDLAEQQIALYVRAGLDKLPICMAKTHLSLSHDPNLKGVPTGYTLPVREVRISRGAGFLFPLLGKMRTMPGLPSRPAFLDVDLDDNGEVVGLF